MGHVNRPVTAQQALLASSALAQGNALSYGTFSRSNAGATYVDPYGTVQNSPVNTPRINNSQLAAVNYVSNPRMLGGTPTVAPTGWGSSGATRTFSYGVGADGNEYVDIRCVSPGAIGTGLLLQAYWDASKAIKAVAGNTITSSAIVRLVAGKIPGNVQLIIVEQDDAAGNPSYKSQTISLTDVATQFTQTAVLTQGTTTNVSAGIWVYTSDPNLPADFTIRISQPNVGYTSGYAGFARGAGGTVGPHSAFQFPRLLIEESRVNAIRNPRGEGAVPGTPGTMPTNWSTNFTGSGLTGSVVGTGTENGLPYVDFRIAGTATGNVFPGIWFETVSGIATAAAARRALSAYLRLVAGSWANIAGVGLGGYELDGASAFLASNSGTIAFPTQAPLSTQRYNYNATIGSAGAAFWQPFVVLSIANGSVVDVTFRIGAPQDELGAFPTSLILPTAGAPAATTRSPDYYNIATPGLLKYLTPVTNLLLQSQTLDSGTWSKIRANVTADAIAAPDGTTTAEKVFTDATAANTHVISQTATVVQGQPYTISAYFKAAEYAAVRLSLASNAFPAGSLANFDLTGSGAATTAGGVTASIQALTGGWYRCSMTQVATASVLTTFSISLLQSVGASQSFDGDGVSGIYAWGAQLEANALANPYIPTVASQVTKTKLAPGTIVVRSRIEAVVNGTWGIFTLSDGTAANRFGLRYYSGGIVPVDVSPGPTINMSPVLATPAVVGTSYLTALSWDDNGMIAAVNGVALAYPNVPLPLGITMLGIGQGSPANFWLNGEINRVVYYPYKMTAAQLQAVTV